MCNQIPTCNFCRSKERLVHVNRVAWWLQCHYTITQLVAHQGPYQGVCLIFMGATTKNPVVSHVPVKISSLEIQKHQRGNFPFACTENSSLCLFIAQDNSILFSLHCFNWAPESCLVSREFRESRLMRNLFQGKQLGQWAGNVISGIMKDSEQRSLLNWVLLQGISRIY